ncbi:MAG: radical SAM protein, partial [Methanosarcinaceae archaeon]|nr:radical SAM protein [Methanosarcinaceae archaeon]
FLKRVLESGLLVRRINIRQVMAFPGTMMYGNDMLVKKHKKQFLKYKEMVRRDIDLPMLRRIVPTGTVLRDVMCEVSDNITFGRQFGSYPILVGIPEKLPTGRFMDVTVTGHGHRSITGIPYPLEINNTSFSLIKELPGVGKKRAAEILRGIPYEDREDLITRVENGKELIQYIKI